MLLRFRVANHRCLRDLTTLSLTQPTLRTNVPPDGDWMKATSRVAGIYGPNASGKSTVLHALHFMSQAVRLSASSWTEDRYLPYNPFLLDDDSDLKASTYEIDIVVNNTRYAYGFESASGSVQREWLYSYPNQRRRTLFERDTSSDNEFFFGRNLTGDTRAISRLTEPHNLFLSVAGRAKHPVLRPIFEHIGRKIRYAAFTHDDQFARMRLVKKVLEDKVLLRKTEALLRFADLGISKINLGEEEVSSERQEWLRNMLNILPGTQKPTEDQLKKVFDELKRTVLFEHTTESGSGAAELDIDDESAGTAAWLTLAVPALISIEKGDIFLIDEIDSSLHTKLCAALISIFKDQEINRTGAQLIFTSHDVSLLGRLGGNSLAPDEIWFTEKSQGVTELFSLHEFQTRRNDNFEKRYLEGRYGAVPMIEIDELKSELAYVKMDSE
ncbi:AAA family ATPase [Amycolatopsis sp. NPDC003731]